MKTISILGRTCQPITRTSVGLAALLVLTDWTAARAENPAETDEAAQAEPVAEPVMPQAMPMVPPAAGTTVDQARMQRRFKAGRVLYGVGTGLGMVGAGLTVSSIVVGSALGLEGTSGQVAPILAYTGTGMTGGAFILSATGLGLQHSALMSRQADPGRGLFATGTVLGTLGLFGVGASYFLSATQLFDAATPTAFGVSLGATALMTLGGLFYFADARRLGQAYRRITSF